MTQEARPYSVRGVISKDGKILLARHNTPGIDDKWTFPGGRLNPDDLDPIQALRREMREELSLEIEATWQIGTFRFPNDIDYTVFAAYPLGEIGQLRPEEILEIAWFTPTEIYKLQIEGKVVYGFEVLAILTYFERLPIGYDYGQAH